LRKPNPTDWLRRAAESCPPEDYEAFMGKLNADKREAAANAVRQSRYRDEQRKLGRMGQKIYLTEDEFSQVKRFIEELRAKDAR